MPSRDLRLDFANDAHPKPRAGRAGLKVRLRVGVLTCALSFAIPAFAQDAGEISFWESVQSSKNPAELRAYLQAYPQGQFAALARVRIAALGGDAQPSPQPSGQAHASLSSPAERRH